MMMRKLEKLAGRQNCARCSGDEVWCEDCVAKLAAVLKKRRSRKLTRGRVENAIFGAALVALAVTICLGPHWSAYADGVFIGFWASKLPQTFWASVLAKRAREQARITKAFSERAASLQQAIQAVSPQPAPATFAVPSALPGVVAPRDGLGELYVPTLGRVRNEPIPRPEATILVRAVVEECFRNKTINLQKCEELDAQYQGLGEFTHDYLKEIATSGGEIDRSPDPGTVSWYATSILKEYDRAKTKEANT